MLPRSCRSLSVLSLSLIFCFSLHASDLRIKAEYAGERYDVVGLRPTIVIDADGAERVLQNARLVIEGDAGPSLDIGFSPLIYAVERQHFDYHRQQRGGDLYHYRVDVSWVLDSNEEIWSREEDLSNVWHEADIQDESAVWLLAWWKSDSNTWTGEVSIGSGSRRLVRASLNISESAVHGRPVILLWRNGVLVPPTRYAEDPANESYVHLQAGKLPPEGEFLEAGEDSVGYSWPSYAASWGDSAWFEQLARHSEGDPPKTSRAVDPLMLAAMHGHAHLIPRLLEWGYRPNVHDEAGMNAGHLAAKDGHAAVLQALLEGGYRVGTDTKDGVYEPLSLALDYGHDDIFAMLRSAGATMHAFNRKQKNDLLASHALRGSVHSANFILEKKADPNAVINDRSILCYGVLSGNPEIVSTLLAAGANPNPKKPPFPLTVACQNDHTEMARLLLKAGADPNRGGEPRNFPLHAAVFHGNSELVRLLLEHGAQPGAIPYEDQPIGLVEMATIAGRNHIVTELFGAGATCRFTPELADDMLILAISNDILEMAVLAFEACVSPGFKFYDEYSPNWVAAYYGAESVSAWFNNVGFGEYTLPPRLAQTSEIDAGPRLLETALPQYTEEMFLRYGNFSEHVTLLVDEAGMARFPKFNSGNLPPKLAIDLHSHLSQWRFKPAEVDGVPVKLIVQFPLTFTYTPPSPETYEVRELSEPPRPLKQPAPRYPPSMQRRRVNGMVRVTFVVTPEGNVEQIDIIRATHPLLRPAVAKAVERWKFSPGKKDGKAVHSRVYINIPFKTR